MERWPDPGLKSKFPMHGKARQGKRCLQGLGLVSGRLETEAYKEEISTRGLGQEKQS
jgi:hypothetical protein